MKLPCFREGDDDQEDPVEVEKKEEEANPENMVAIDMRLHPIGCRQDLSITTYIEEKRAQFIDRPYQLSTADSPVNRLEKATDSRKSQSNLDFYF